eukprot:SAG31_NODE_3826_length_3846_cov_4.431697_3_plen_99_part_00
MATDSSGTHQADALRNNVDWEYPDFCMRMGADMLDGVGRSTEISASNAVDLSTTNLTGSVGSVADLTASAASIRISPVSMHTPNLEVRRQCAFQPADH